MPARCRSYDRSFGVREARGAFILYVWYTGGFIILASFWLHSKAHGKGQRLGEVIGERYNHSSECTCVRQRPSRGQAMVGVWSSLALSQIPAGSQIQAG
jgi:hypothetical protein